MVGVNLRAVGEGCGKVSANGGMVESTLDVSWSSSGCKEGSSSSGGMTTGLRTGEEDVSEPATVDEAKDNRGWR